MNTNELMLAVADYYPAILALAVLCVAVLVQSFLAGVLGLAKSDEEPGRPLKGSHEDFSFRVLRTYANSTENLPAFAVALLLAVLAGVSPSWVNALAIFHVVLRMIYWGVYYSGIGVVGGGPRTVAYAVGMFANLILALVTVYTMLA